MARKEETEAVKKVYSLEEILGMVCTVFERSDLRKYLSFFRDSPKSGDLYHKLLDDFSEVVDDIEAEVEACALEGIPLGKGPNQERALSSMYDVISAELREAIHFTPGSDGKLSQRVVKSFLLNESSGSLQPVYKEVREKANSKMKHFYLENYDLGGLNSGDFVIDVVEEVRELKFRPYSSWADRSGKWVNSWVRDKKVGERPDEAGFRRECESRIKKLVERGNSLSESYSLEKICAFISSGFASEVQRGIQTLLAGKRLRREETKKRVKKGRIKDLPQAVIFLVGDPPRGEVYEVGNLAKLMGNLPRPEKLSIWETSPLYYKFFSKLGPEVDSLLSEAFECYDGIVGPSAFQSCYRAQVFKPFRDAVDLVLEHRVDSREIPKSILSVIRDLLIYNSHKRFKDACGDIIRKRKAGVENWMFLLESPCYYISHLPIEKDISRLVGGIVEK